MAGNFILAPGKIGTAACENKLFSQVVLWSAYKIWGFLQTFMYRRKICLSVKTCFGRLKETFFQ